jgi:hypothetical protein
MTSREYLDFGYEPIHRVRNGDGATGLATAAAARVRVSRASPPFIAMWRNGTGI